MCANQLNTPALHLTLAKTQIQLLEELATENKILKSIVLSRRGGSTHTFRGIATRYCKIGSKIESQENEVIAKKTANM